MARGSGRTKGHLLILTRVQVAALLPMSAALEVVRQAAAEYSRGAALIPLRTSMETHQPEGEMLVMPGYLPGPGAIGVKIYSCFPGPDGLSEGTALMVFRDLRDGLEVIMDAGWLTDMRTGAMTGVACQLLAPPDARRLALIGTGTQARTQLDGVAATTQIEAVEVWSRGDGGRASFVAAARERHPGLVIHGAASAKEAIRDADIVVTATTAAAPVFEDEWLKPGAVVCGIGSHSPETSEIDPRTVGRASLVVVDTRRGVITGAGDVAVPVKRGLIREGDIVELGELVMGATPGGNGNGPRVFKSVGFAALDVLAAKTVSDAAIARGIGRRVTLH